MRLEHPREAVALERVDRVERLRRGRSGELDELGCAVEAQERVREIVRAPGGARSQRVGVQLAPGREQQVDERCADRPEDVQEQPREPASDAAQLDEGRREEDDERLDEGVAAADMRKLVRDGRFELLAAQCLSAPTRPRASSSTGRGRRRRGAGSRRR